MKGFWVDEDSFYTNSYMLSNLTLMNQSNPFIPVALIDEISRDSWIAEVEAGFSQNCAYQTVIGDPLSGKSNLLSQFARKNANRAICYFPDSSPISKTSYYFLFTVCTQIASLLKKPEPKPEITHLELKTLFSSLCNLLIRQSAQKGVPYFIIIDGLEQFINTATDDSIFDIFPPPLGSKVYLLSSISESNHADLPKEKLGKIIHTRRFEIHETERFFEKKQIPSEKIRKIHNSCQGHPGYLNHIKQAITNDSQFDFENIPEKLKDHLKEQVRKASKKLTDLQVKVLKGLSSVPIAIPLRVIEKAFNGFSKELDLHALMHIDFIKYKEKQDEIYIVNEFLRSVIAEHFTSDHAQNAKVLLEASREAAPNDTLLLNTLLIISKDYDTLKTLLIPEKIYPTILDTKSAIADIGLRTRLAIEIATVREDMPDLVSWVVLNSIRKSFIDHVSDRPEIKALIALSRFDLAYERVSLIPDDYSKAIALCQLLAAENLNRIPNHQGMIDELKTILYHLPLNTLDKDLIEDLAIEVYPVLPNEADGLLQKLNNASILNTLEHQVKVEAEDENKEDEKALHRLIMKRIGKFGMANSANKWLSSLSYEAMQSKLMSIESRSGQLRFILDWCEAQEDSIDICDAVNQWLNLAVAASEISILMSSLRRLAEALSKRPVSTANFDTAIRIDQISISPSLLRAPYEEWIKCQISIAEIVGSKSKGQGREKIITVIESTINELKDLDIQVFCLARCWLASKRLVITDIKLREISISGLFHQKLQTLLNQSAEHLDLLADTITILTEIDLESAIMTCIELNTQRRRSISISNVLLSIPNESLAKDISTSIAFALKILLEIDRMHHEMLLQALLIHLKKQSKFIHRNNIKVFLEAIEDCSTPSRKALMYAILSGLEKKYQPQYYTEYPSKIQESWSKESHLPLKVSYGYHVVYEIAINDPSFATKFYDDVFKIANTSDGNLAQGPLGFCYQRTIEIAIRLLTIQDTLNRNELLDTFDKYTEYLISPEIKAVIFLKLTSRIRRLGNSEFSELVIRERLIPLIKNITNSIQYARFLTLAYPTLFEYDFELAKKLLPEDSPVINQVTLANTIISIFSKHYAGNPLPKDHKIKNLVEYRDILKATLLLNDIKSDIHFYNAVTAICFSIAQTYERNQDSAQATDLLYRIYSTAKTNLPDKENIQHIGYLILTESRIVQTRTKLLLHQIKKNISPRLKQSDILNEWDGLLQNTKLVSNIADRTFILAHLAQSIGDLPVQVSGDRQFLQKLQKLADDILQDAQSMLKDIPTLLDRCERMVVICEAYAILHKIDKLDHLIKEVNKESQKLRRVDADQIFASCIQALSHVDSDIADKFFEKLDTRRGNLSMPQLASELALRKLISNPSRLNTINNDTLEINDLMDKATQSFLSDISSGQPFRPSLKQGADWLQTTQKCNPDVAFQTVDWAIETFENQLRGSKGLSFRKLLEFTDITVKLAQIGTNVIIDRHPNLSMIDKNSRLVHTYRQGERDKAIRDIACWLQKNVENHLIICDPYFEPENIQFLQHVPQDCAVTIVSCNHKLGDSDQDIQNAIRKEWKNIANWSIPKTVIYILDKSEEGSFHDRSMTSKGAVLHIGPSLSGLGNQIGTITELYKEMAEEYQTEHIDQLLNESLWRRKSINYKRILCN